MPSRHDTGAHVAREVGLLCFGPKGGLQRHATVRGNPGHRRHPCAGGAVRGLSARACWAPTSSRSRIRTIPTRAAASGTDKALNDAQMGTAFLTQASNKRSIALDLKTGARPRDPQEAGRDRRRVRRELPARRVRGAGARLRRALGDQSAADLRLVLGLRPERPARQPDRLRPRHPGDLRHHGDDRHEGRASGQVRLAGGRLRDRHDRRVRALGRAVPARAHRQRPAHRHGDARRGDDPDGLAPHRLSAQRRASQAPRQPPSARDQRRVRRQGRQRW